MFKKVLTTTVLGVSALTVMAANAAAPGVYVTGQLGYANTHMGSKTNIADINKNTPAAFNFSSNNGNDTNLANNGLSAKLLNACLCSSTACLRFAVSIFKYITLGLAKQLLKFEMTPGRSTWP